MMQKFKTVLFICILTLYTITLYGQNGGVEMAEAMRESGKIYVVIAVLSAIFLGIIVFLVFLERKIKKLENEIDAQK